MEPAAYRIQAFGAIERQGQQASVLMGEDLLELAVVRHANPLFPCIG